MVKLNEQQEENLKYTFLESLGEKIRMKRKQKSLSLAELADCLHVSAASLSQYESGKNDMKVSKLAFISTYCDFPLTDFFERDQSKELLNSFSKMVQITKRRYQRKKECSNNDAIVKEPEAQYESGFQREKYIKAEMPSTETAFTDKEFVEYLQNNQSKEFIEAMIGSAKMIEYLSDKPDKQYVQEILADTMIEGIVLEPVIHKKEYDKAAMRLYAYYKALMNTKKTDNFTDCLESSDNQIDEYHVMI